MQSLKKFFPFILKPAIIIPPHEMNLLCTQPRYTHNFDAQHGNVPSRIPSAT